MGIVNQALDPNAAAPAQTAPTHPEPPSDAGEPPDQPGAPEESDVQGEEE
jgi:hypothetical protein